VGNQRQRNDVPHIVYDLESKEGGILYG
jgi:hypothetical protein